MNQLNESKHSSNDSSKVRKISNIKVICFAFILCGATAYFTLVLFSSYIKSKEYTINIKPGFSLPDSSGQTSKECDKVIKLASLNPYFDSTPPHDKHDFPDYREYASVWWLDHARTEMYNESLLRNPACFGFLVSKVAIIENRRIIVIYDTSNKKDILIIRNY